MIIITFILSYLKRMRLHFSSGLTWIELIVVIALIAIITALATPSFAIFKAEQEKKDSMHLIKIAVSHAKQATQLYHHDVLLCPSQNGRDCLNKNTWQHGLLLVEDRNKNRQADATEQRLYFFAQDLQYGTLTWQGSLHKNLIVFQSDTGLPRGYIGSFKYCHHQHENHSYRMTLSMMGHLRQDANSRC